jgi:hypothetical protein
MTSPARPVDSGGDRQPVPERTLLRSGFSRQRLLDEACCALVVGAVLFLTFGGGDLLGAAPPGALGR